MGAWPSRSTSLRPPKAPPPPWWGMIIIIIVKLVDPGQLEGADGGGGQGVNG